MRRPICNLGLAKQLTFPHNIGGKGCVFSRPGRLWPRGRVHATFSPDIMGKTLHRHAACICLSGQPKGLSFGFRPKVLVSVGAEMFRQKSAFRPKYSISAEITPVSAEISLFRQDILRLFRPKDLISAKITLLRPK